MGVTVMQPGKYDRTIEMLCPTCGGTQFSDTEAGDEVPVTCSACGLKLSRDELRQANDANVSAHVDEVKKEIVSDLQKMVRDAFRGNKNFRIK